MTKFDDIIEVILEHEGGYVNDPKDLGGETKYGITKRFYPDLDIKNLSKDEARKIYYEDYWLRFKVPEIPDQLKHIYFDMCVNQGVGTAVKIIQKALNSKGANLKVDGGLGPNTIKTLHEKKICKDRLTCYRLKHYYDLVNKKPEQERFLFGWFRRAKSLT